MVLKGLKVWQKKVKTVLTLSKIHFNKKLATTKEDDEDFENSNKCWICDNTYIDDEIKLRNHCHIAEKYIGSAHRNCYINVKLNRKILFKFHNVKNYDTHLIT